MEKYVKPEMEVVKFDAEDVIMASGYFEGYAPDVCGADGGGCFDFGCRVN